MKEDVAITVLMPAYNAAPYIAEAIASVLAQSFTDFELLIINDGSTDDTVSIIASFHDSRISVIHQRNSGVAAALNNGLNKARGRYIARFDADDVCLPERLETQFAYMEAHPEYVITGSDAIYISETGDYLCHYSCVHHTNTSLKSTMHTICPFTHSSVMFRKKEVIACGGYSTRAHNMEDHLLWIQLSEAGKFYNFPIPLIKVRFNASSVTIDEKWRGKRFRELKYGILRNGAITAAQGEELMDIIQRQDTRNIKRGAYYALCGKKLLANNHQPAKARNYIRKAIHAMPLRADNYALFAISYFPENFVKWLYYKLN